MASVFLQRKKRNWRWNGRQAIFVLLGLIVTLALTMSWIYVLHATVVERTMMWGPPQKTLDDRLLKQLTQPNSLIMRPKSLTTAPSLTTVMTTTGRNADKTCYCELVSVDCLDSIQCIPEDNHARQQTVALGVLTREIMKQTTNFAKNVPSSYIQGQRVLHPMGKTLQYSTILSFEWWTSINMLPIGFRGRDAYVNETLYPYCIEHGLKGKQCFFDNANSTEDLDTLERDAVANVPIYDSLNNSMVVRSVTSDLNEFRNTSTTAPALGNLLVFSHILRLLFNRRPHVRDFYTNHLTSILHIKNDMKGPNTPLTVGLHIRRADSCGVKEYAVRASTLDSGAQMGGTRMCYNTSVYVDALRRVQTLARGRPIEVFLSTDHAGSVMAELKSFHDVYPTMNWHYLNYSREIFEYSHVISIDFASSMEQSMLGETAVVDLWHLSHGEVFIGHLGSRFGKVAWLLATARHNSFVPFATVDGHSFCCEIDENCSDMKPYIKTMKDCMTFATELTGKSSENYWEVGSTVRKELALKQLQGTAAPSKQ